MRLLTDLQRVLPYDLVTINQENYTIARDVYSTNPEYFALLGKAADDESILTAVNAVPDGFDIADKLFAAICRDDRAVAVIDLLAGYPTAVDLWIGLILVHGNMRSGGVGANIVNGVVQAAGAAGFGAVHLGAAKANVGALRFWQKMGFVQERQSGDFLVFKRSVHEGTY